MLNPITALAFWTYDEGQYLLAAEDTDIRVYDTGTSQLLGTLPVFQAQPIHGISAPGTVRNDAASSGASKCPSQILVWGGHTVKIVTSYLLEELVRSHSRRDDNGSQEQSDADHTWLSVPETIAPDWIFDGRISPFDDGRVILLTAHNDVIQAQISEDQKTLALGRVLSPSRPILYSGNLFWVARDCMLVAAGTVFGEILVWKCHVDSNPSQNHDTRAEDARSPEEGARCEVLFVFSGHEGSIFGVNISPEILTDSGEKIRLLASCSDDRTVRIWDITERNNKSLGETNGFDKQISDARQTGFGDSMVDSTELVNSHSRCIAMAMGHISRIWQVEIKSPSVLSKKEPIEVFSFGEDATMQRWRLELDASLESISKAHEIGASNSDNGPPFKLTHHETLSHHDGKQIWSRAMMSNGNELLIVTGGGDGKIALMKIDTTYAPGTPDDAINSYQRSIQELDVSPTYLIERCRQPGIESSPLTPSFKHGNGKEMFQSFSFIRDDRLLVTTRSGRLFLCSFGSETVWRELKIPSEIQTTIQSYTILRSSRRASMTFIGAPNGELFSYHEPSGDSLHLIHKTERKITEIICVSDTLATSHHIPGDSNGVSNGYIEVLVIAVGTTKAELLRLGQDRTLIQQTEVMVPDGFIITTAAWCHGHLVLGSRNGDMSIFGPAHNGSCSPILTIKVNAGDKITSILPLPKRSAHSPLYFLTTTRDGKYRIYEILDNAGSLQVLLLHEMRPPFGPLVEGSWLFDRPDGKQDLMLYGFRGKHFVVWNATQQSEIGTIDCGGGHRVFDQVQIGGNPEGFRFACTKASQMKIFSQICAPHAPLKTGGHGREIKAVSASGRYVATGAEDTMIRIWELCGIKQRQETAVQQRQPLRCVLSLEKHNTGIQTLKWSTDRYLFSSGGNEEFFAWRITPLGSDVCPLGVICEAVFPDRSEIGDLRITDFDVHCLDGDEREGVDAISGGRRIHPRFCITMALSNSTVQSYLYSALQGFTFLGRRTYTGACLTQVAHLGLVDGHYPQILTASTDGHLAVFPDMRHSGNETDDSVDVVVTKLHQSTVKSLDVRSVVTEAGVSYLVVTGGDDDAIGVVHLHLPDLKSPPPPDSRERIPGPFEVRNKFVVRSAHAAAVTGIGIVRLENKGRDAVIVTASNDQRVKTWRLTGWQTASPNIHMLDNRYSGVADTGDLEIVKRSSARGSERKLPGDDSGKKGEKVLVAGVGIEVWDIA